MAQQKLYINNNPVELTEDSSVALNYSISDISEPDKVKGDFSKTITLPGSKAVNKVFSKVFEINVDLTGASYNPNVKAEALYTVGDIEIIDGFVKLNKINWSNGVCHSYEVNIFGRNANLFTDIGESKLEELDLSEFDHDWTLANEENSWNTSIIENGVPVAFELGKGYVYPDIDYGHDNDELTKDVVHMYPAVYVKQYWDKIFQDAGYQYNSSFLESDYFKRLIIPYNGIDLRLSEQQVEDRTSIMNSAVVNTVQPTFGFTQADIDYTNIVQDNLGQVDLVANDITVDQSGYYNLISEVNYNAVFTPNTVNDVFSMVAAGSIIRIMVNGTLVAQKSVIISTDGNSFNTSYTTAINPAPPSDEYWRLIGAGGVLSDNNLFNPASVSIATRENYFLEVGDVVRSEIFHFLTPVFPYDGIGGGIFPTNIFEDAATPGVYYSGTVDLNMNASDFRMIPVVSSLAEGNEIQMNNAIPRDIKQVDFVKGIVNMHNLYIQPQRENPNVLDIEPRDDFYSGDVIDWTERLDLSKDFIIEPLGALKDRIFEFKYKEDQDYYNKQYQDNYQEGYGEREFITDNEYLKNTKTVEVVFSPTPLVGDASHDRVTPEIFKEDPANGKTQLEHNIRIIYYGGLKDTNVGWTHTSSLVADVVNTQYPYAGHLDDPYNPTIDLNFGLPREIFYDGTWQAVNGTNNNLVNAYYYNQLNEITNINSKIVTGWFNLSPLDISNLSFKKDYYFNRSYFRLQKVIDYNPIGCGSTKCEFIKLEDIQPFNASTFVINGGAGSITGGLTDEALPTTTKSAQNGNVRGRRRDVDITGENNYVDPNAKNVKIVGDNNQVLGDVKNVVIFGDNVTATESDKVYVGKEEGALTDHHSGWELIQQDKTAIVAEFKQMINHNKLEIDGTLNIDGTLILE